MHDILNSPLFPLEELSPETFVKLPKTPHAESKSVKLYIILAEPHLYLEGFTKDEVLSRPPSILRGCLFLRILHPVKIKEINLKLKGVSRTEWPEGIPPKKTEHFESKGILNHTWPFFSYLNSYPVTANSRNNADLFIPKSDSDVSNFSLDGNNSTLSPVTSASDLKPVLSPVSLLKSFRNTSTTLTSITSSSDLTTSLSSSGNDDNKLFPPGDYVYSFELPIQSSLPESVCVTFGSITYSLEAHVERSGAFRSSLTARRPLSIVRAPFENSSEENEPIIIDRDWENRLQYDIVIYSKQVILNSYLPISFRMIPLEKIKVHRLRVYITEHLEYYCHNKKVHRTEPPKKILLLEHKPPKDCDNLLSLGNDEIGGVELDFQVFIPEFYNEKFHLHPDTTSEDVQSHHWIKISIRISKPEPTPDDPTKRKQYELSIDSPMHILSSQCVHANTLLPSYDEQIRLDIINSNINRTTNSITETNTNKTLTPISSNRQSLDKMMSPRDDTILDSNLFKPDDSVPVEMLSAQAKPFSPIASPQLNAISPELRETPLMRSLDLSPIVSPINNRSRSASRVSTVRSRNLSPTPRNTASVRSISSVNEPPPPPFIENPPTYAEATKTLKTKKDALSRRRETTNSSVSMDSSNSGNSGSSGLSFSAGKNNSNSGNNTTSTTASNNNGTTNSSNSIPTRISLNLGASMGNISGMNNNGSNLQLHRLGSGLIPISQLNPSGTGTTASSTPSESTPSISAFLDSPLSHPDNSSKMMTQPPPPPPPQPRSPSPSPVPPQLLSQGQADMAPSTVTTVGTSPTRGRKKENRDPFSYDLAQDTDLRFKITPIRSASGSPYLRAQQYPSATSILNHRTASPMRSASPFRSASPVPIVATDRNLNKLVNSTFMPGFSLDGRSPEKTTRETFPPTQMAPLVAPQINITESNNDILPTTTTATASSSVSSASPQHHLQRQSAELSSVDQPLLRGDAADDDGNFSDSSAEEYAPHSGGLSETYNLHSNTLGSLNSLDMMLNGNRSQYTLNNGGDASARSGASPGRGVSLNYLGNTTDGFDDGTDITSMPTAGGGGAVSPSMSVSSLSSHWGKLRNPKLARPPPE